MITDAIYGNPPIDLGLIDIKPTEMMAWLYLPIRTPASAGFVVPPNLLQFMPIVERAWSDGRGDDQYVYLTAKTLWIDQSTPANRPGWHSDGFLSDDLNYVWSDRSPTVFWQPEQLVTFSADHNVSLLEMEAAAEKDLTHHVRYPDRHLLRLDQTVIHKVDSEISAGWRSFVKVSISRHRYCLIGNSINHDLPMDCDYAPRLEVRNCPITEVSK